MAGAIESRLALTLAEVKSYCRVNGNQDDTTLSLILAAIKCKADQHCNNPFTNDAGTPETIPADVKLGVLQLIERAYRRKAAGVGSTAVSGMATVTWTQGELNEALGHRRLPPGLGAWIDGGLES